MDGETGLQYLLTQYSGEEGWGIGFDELMSLAEQSRAAEVIIILDCCEAGAFGESLARWKRRSVSVVPSGTTVLAACRSYQQAKSGFPQSAFTAELLKAFSGAAGDRQGKITAAGVFSQIDSSMETWAQRPVFKANVDRMTSLRAISPRT